MNAESADTFIGSLTAFEPEYAPWLDRTAALATLKDRGLPRTRSESWKYSNPTPLYSVRDCMNADIKSIEAEHGVQVDGFDEPNVRALISDRLDSLVDFRKHPLAAVNRLLVNQGRVITVEKNGRGSLRIRASGGSYERYLVVLEPGSELEIIESDTGSHRVMECHVGEGATLRHRRLQPEAQTHDYNLVCVSVASDASYLFEQYSAGATLRRNDVVVNLNGAGADVELNGAWRLDDHEHLDNQITVNHNIGGGNSRQRFHGYVTDRAKSVFNGRIYIARDAQKSDASLSNRNLLESVDAEVYAKPELEIYADDVACSHGATVGQLDPDALFYLRSRGIDAVTARRTLVRGFLNEAIDHEDGRLLLGIGV